METADATAYHLSELKIARDPSADGHLLPPVPNGCRAVLDIGCGAGQTLIALDLPEPVLACGVDPDASALALGQRLTDRVRFAAAAGEALPYAAESFDLVFSRVALPYTNIPAALREIERVLRPGGTLWLSLHPPAMVMGWLRLALLEGRAKRVLYLLYVLANGMLLGLAGRQVGWPFGRRGCESCQTKGGIRRALRRARLEPTRGDGGGGRFFVVTARKPSPPARATSAARGSLATLEGAAR